MEHEKSAEVWLRTDERLDVVSSLLEVQRALNAVSTDVTAWKWAVIGIHSALQGAMVCHLSGTANVGALTRKSVKEVLSWRENEENGVGCGAKSKGAPREKVADAKELFCRLQKNSKRFEYGAGQTIAVTSDEKRAFNLIHCLRNDFSHFSPKGWSIEVSGLPNALLELVGLFRRISRDPWPFRHMEIEQKEHLRQTVEEIERILKSVLT